jgi:hypothetical protein
MISPAISPSVSDHVVTIIRTDSLCTRVRERVDALLTLWVPTSTSSPRAAKRLDEVDNVSCTAIIYARIGRLSAAENAVHDLPLAAGQYGVQRLLIYYLFRINMRNKPYVPWLESNAFSTSRLSRRRGGPFVAGKSTWCDLSIVRDSLLSVS